MEDSKPAPARRRETRRKPAREPNPQQLWKTSPLRVAQLIWPGFCPETYKDETGLRVSDAVGEGEESRVLGGAGLLENVVSGQNPRGYLLALVSTAFGAGFDHLKTASRPSRTCWKFFWHVRAGEGTSLV